MSVLLTTNTTEEGEGEQEEGNGSSLYDSVERGEMSGGEATSFDSFFAMLHKQNEHLTGHAKSEFQKRWGFDSGYDSSDSESNIFGSEHDVPTGISLNIRRKLCCHKHMKTRKHLLLEAIVETSQISTDKIGKLKRASDMHVGLEIMHHFIIDLLGYAPSCDVCVVYSCIDDCFVIYLFMLFVF